MKMSEQFAGSYFKATDLPQPRTLTIETVLQAKMPEGDTKPALKFAGESQQLILNKTNAFILVDLFGDETATWHGRQVELHSTQTSFGGRMVPCIRVRQPQQPVYHVTQPTMHPAQQPVYQAPPQQVPPLIQTPALQPVPQSQGQQPITAPPADYPLDA